MKTRDSFVFYRSFFEAIDDLNEGVQLEVFRAISTYALEGIEPNVEGYSKAIFRLIKPQLDANNKRFENGKKGAEYGKLGGRPRKGETPEQPQNTLTKTPNVNVNVNENQNENQNGNENPAFVMPEISASKMKKFVIPSIEEIRTYCHERKNLVDAEKFYNFYEAKGWLIGKNKMKDWKASIHTWEKGSSLPNNQQKKSNITNLTGREKYEQF